MTISKGPFLVAALAMIAVIATPRMSLAGSYSGAWIGSENYQITQNGQVTSSGSMAATLEWFFDDSSQLNEVAILGSNNSYADVIGSGLSGQFGGGLIDQSIVATIQGEYDGYDGYYSGLPGTGNIFASYLSIDQNGNIDTAGQSAVADITLINFYNDEVLVVSFNAVNPVPEPSSIVLAASGLLTILAFAWLRGFRPRPRLRLLRVRDWWRRVLAAPYQARLSFVMGAVAIAALAFAALPYLGWAIAGFPYRPRYVRTIFPDGSAGLMDGRVWETHHLNPKNRALDRVP